MTVKTRSAAILFLATVSLSYNVNGYNKYVYNNYDVSFVDPTIVTFDHARQKRETPAPPATLPAAPVNATTAPVAPAPGTVNDDSNRTVNPSKASNATMPPTAVAVTQTPLLGTNGTGQRWDNVTGSSPTVSDPLFPDDNLNITEVFRETPETMKAEQNITDLKYDNHNFYNSSFIGNVTYFNEYWKNLTTEKADVHAVLSNSHRRATTLRLSFEFPFYGHALHNITVATGGFIYTGEHVHNWLAATQYIAPLMANFDTTLTNDSYVKMYDDGEKFTALWENVTLQEDLNKKFTFAVTLYKSGDIVFAYKDIPVGIQNINDGEHPVKVGISDAYLTDRILFLVRRKTIYEYHRVSFKNYEISNHTLLRLHALPTCLAYDTCEGCLNHRTGFDCMWCEAIRKCSSGTDRNKQDWMLRNCDKVPVTSVAACPAPARPHADPPAAADAGNTAYVTDTQSATHTAVNTLGAAEAPAVRAETPAAAHAHAARSPVGGAVAGFVAVTLLCSAAAWILYAFKNPHTRSGQLLIKYRPSQWSWRRGEARYTAATIHM